MKINIIYIYISKCGKTNQVILSWPARGHPSFHPTFTGSTIDSLQWFSANLFTPESRKGSCFPPKAKLYWDHTGMSIVLSGWKPLYK